ncbi:MAG: phasin family protein [Actinomycetota bacterium]|jgi:polyhydroxyalkanoate synthesis regulator phasin
MLDTVRKYVEAGREALTPKKAEDLAKSLVKQGQARRDQAAKLAKDILEWSRESSDRLGQLIRREVKKQISKAGLATKDELESVKRRIRKLEGQGKKSTRKRTTGSSGRSTSRG